MRSRTVAVVKGVAGATIAGVLLAGCTSVQAGKAASNPADVQRVQLEHTPLNGRDALGDIPTLDYCSLLDQSAAQQGGATDPGTEMSSYDMCDLPAKLGGKEVHLQVGYAATRPSAEAIPPPDAEPLPRGLIELQVIRGEDDTGCDFYLKFTDGYFVRATGSDYVDATGKPSGADYQATCRLGKAVLAGVVQAVLAGKVGHLTYPAGSVGTVDACRLLTMDQLTAQFGSPLEPDPSLGRHICHWRRGAQSLALVFYVDKPQWRAAGDVQETHGGRQTLVFPSDSYCSLTTDLGPAPGAKDGEVSTAGLLLNGLDDASCAKGKALADAIWPKLPAA